jgi:photosystem II stability/assembly factor-like uncharacterized protein
MRHDSTFERSLRDALESRLGGATGRYPEWGLSPQAKGALWPGIAPRRGLSARTGVAAAAVLVVALVVAAVAVFRVNPTAVLPRSSCAGCGGSAIWAAVAFDDQNIVAVGEGEGGGLLLVRSADGGRTWKIEHPKAPAMRYLARAGARLYGSIGSYGSGCLPTYPPEMSEPSGADVAYGPGVDHSFYPAPASCLYYSDDQGRSWHDARAGQLIDPTFADASNGFAHTEMDTIGKVAGLLYATTDGGRSWHSLASPCSPATPYIQQAVATGRDAGYVLCAAPWSTSPDPMETAVWKLVQVEPNAAPIVRLSSDSSGVPPASYMAGFFMRPNGSGWAMVSATTPAVASDEPYGWAAYVYRTADGGESWQPEESTGDWLGPLDPSFVSDDVGLAAFASTGAKSGVMETTDGGLTWRTLAAWEWWSFEPLPAAS